MKKYNTLYANKREMVEDIAVLESEHKETA